MLKQINYKDELNEQQLEAVMSTEGPHLVIAGAGSGKTRVLVYRTAYLVERGIDPSRILLLTFTRRAANAMLERASTILDDRCQKVSGGTFHSFANRTLRRYGEYLGIHLNFTILDQADSENIVGMIRRNKNLHKADKKFPKKGTIFSIISKSVNKGLDAVSVTLEEYPYFEEWTGEISAIKDEYVRYKKETMSLDYDDLLISLRDLLEGNENLCRKLSEQYQYIMVDEYQDTNKIQAHIVRLLAVCHQNIMVVGDDSQSIYSFRGAYFKNIIEFPRVFPKTKVITLEENYRSSQPILDLTNEVIKSASEKFEKELFTRDTTQILPVYVSALNENIQSRYIVEKIFRLQTQGVPLNEIAILFRSGWHSNDLEIQLASTGIPFIKYGGQKFVESAHVKDVMSFMRVAHQLSDEVSWLRILTMFKGIGPKGAKGLIEQIRKNEGEDINIKKFKNKEIVGLLEMLRKVDILAQPVEEILDRILNFYYPFLVEQYDDYDKRVNDLNSLQGIASRYNDLEAFVSDMTLDPPEKSIVEQRKMDRNDSHLVLSTIHSAKGLEWHTVFVIFVAEGYLPSYRSFESEEAIEEERRLFYVATTRAKKHLYLLCPQMDRSPYKAKGVGHSVYLHVSRFLAEGRILRHFVDIESW